MNRFGRTNNSAPSPAQVHQRNSGSDSDFVMIGLSDTYSSSAVSSTLQSAAVTPPTIRPEGETPLVHRRGNNGQQVSQLTLLLNAANARSGNTASRNFTVNSLPQTNERPASVMSPPISSSLDAILHRDTYLPPADSPPYYSAYSTSPAIPFLRLAPQLPQINNMIVGTPPFAVRQPSLYLQRDRSIGQNVRIDNRQTGTTNVATSILGNNRNSRLRIFLNDATSLSNRQNQRGHLPVAQMVNEIQMEPINNASDHYSDVARSSLKPLR